VRSISVKLNKMKIIGAGFGRSGTMSIKAALEQIGYGPCYHMKITLFRYDNMRFFMRAWSGKKVNWKRFFHHYNSVVDWPTCYFYRDLMKEFPDAKVLLNIRDPELWYDSMNETIYPIQVAFPFWFPGIVRRMHDKILWEGSLKGVFEDREKCLTVYRQYIEDVKSDVPSERLLIYNVKEGWKPLCDFLGVAVPERKAFPHINERKSFKQLILLLKILNWLVPLVVLVGAAFLILWISVA
jgi:hypothetical protein